MALALYAVVKADQMVHFEVNFKALSNGESINPKRSKAPFYPFMDNGVIRVDGRLAHITVHMQAKSPQTLFCACMSSDSAHMS